jgi:hypothetical protein
MENLIQPKHNLALKIKTDLIKTKIIERISKFENLQSYRNNQEMLVLICNSIEHLVSKGTKINKLDLENLTNLKAPTEKRFYDGAAIANLKIIYNGKIYQSSDFDHGFPPMQIKRVVEMINLLFKPEV